MRKRGLPGFAGEVLCASVLLADGHATPYVGGSAALPAAQMQVFPEDRLSAAAAA